MKEKKLVPKLRFPGFTEPWEQRKLGEIFKERNERSGQGELISVTVSQGVIKAADLDRDINASIDKHNYKVVKPGDVVYNTMRMWQGACGHSPYRGILSPAYTVLIPGKNTLGTLFDYYFKRIELLQIFKKYSQGMTSDTWNLKFDILKQVKLPFPSVEEQGKIVQLFSSCDANITLHQRKLEHLKLKKKSLLQKLFPKEGEVYPELRFPGFTEPWEQRKVNEIFKVTRGQVLAASLTTPKKNRGNIYPVYSSQTKDNGLLGYYSEYLFENAITWTTDGANAGTVNFRPGRFYSTNVNGVLINENGYACYAVSEIINKVAYKYVSKVGNPKLMNNVMAEINIMITPDIDELKQISKLIEAYNQYITLHQRKLEHLQLLKKALLQQLFV